MRPHLAVTLGDPAGIGPEVVLKALADPAIAEDCDLTVVGDRAVLQETERRLQQQAQPFIRVDRLNLLEVKGDWGTPTLGVGDRASGAASFAYLETAIVRTLAGDFQGIVTGPIAKTGWKAAGHDYPGQTELLADKAGRGRFGMLFVAKSPYSGWVLRTLLATTHIALRQVPEVLTPELLTRKLDLLIECLQHDFGLEKPRIAIAGLNPHSGENGQLGSEEKDWLIPWLEKTRDRWPDVQLEGPIPPDTLWVKPGQAWYGRADRAHDAYLALYHDQGLIPVKLMAFDRAVNTTIGLPFIRTSPDHGTAFDLAGQGVADASSMKAALELAVQFAKQRHNTEK